jgi:hypothetical protein
MKEAKISLKKRNKRAKNILEETAEQLTGRTLQKSKNGGKILTRMKD